MAAANELSILNHFRDVKDPRINRTKRHLLLDIVGLAICAVIGGAESWLDIERYGKSKRAWFRKFLALPNGIPSHDTIERLFRRLKPSEFQRCFAAWARGLHEHLGLQHVAIDGKTLRGSFDTAIGKSPLHLVSAWSTENQLTLGQVAVESKSNEITAIPELLGLLDLSGAVVTIDAMGCQKDIVAKIVQAGAGYVLAVKDNQPKLYEDIQDHFLEMHDTDFANTKHSRHETHETSHGRKVDRYYYITPVPDRLRNQTAWHGLRSVGQVVTHTTVNGKQTSDVRYFISSLPSHAKRFAHAVRAHWGIENSLHWILDVTFDEDRSRIRRGQGTENFALLRRIAVSILKRNKTPGSVRGKRKMAGWNNDVMLNVITTAI